MKRIVLCADDYGQNSAVSQAIVTLLEEKRLSATSCMVTSPYWEDQANWLMPYQNQADIGLHFNLTEGKPLSTALPAFFPLNTLILKSQQRQLDKSSIIAELHAQLDRFTQRLGSTPAFIDGHQHVHQFPMIRDALFTVYEERLRDHGVYIRCTYNPWAFFRISDVAYLKNLIIQLCGGLAFKRELIKRRIPYNTSFSGIYDFSQSENYAAFFPRFLMQIKDGGLIMCHPGLASTEPDVISASRQLEFDYFRGEQFIAACQHQQILIARFANT